jgi:Cu(I)/Ag(I) efflux system membrane protein CusA/SilA
MINRLISYCLRTPFVVFVIYACIFFWGLWAIRNIPIDAIPDIGEKQVIVYTEWPGRSAQDVEDQVTYPLSVSLRGVPGVKTIRASSAFGFSEVYLIFHDKIDYYWARSRVLEKLNIAATRLPPNVVPVLGPDATGLGQVFWYTVEGGGKSLEELRTIQDWFVRYQLNSVEGVSEVATVGGFLKQYQIDVDPNKMLAHKIPLHDILEAVKKSNIDIGAKVIESGAMEFIVRGLGFIKSVEDIENIAVGYENGTPIYVKNVANVTIGPEFRRGLLDKDGKEVVGGVVVMRYGQNAMQVIGRVKEKIKELELGLPEGVKIVPFYDRSELIHRTIGTLKEALTLQTIITLAVVLPFLANIWAGITICLTLPFAIFISFILMNLLKIDANIMSLAGIAIAIGELADMGIVFTENIYRRLVQRGEDIRNKLISRLDVVYEAASEVGKAVFTSAMTMIFSFFPIFALTAQEGKLFHPLAWTKSLAILGAITIALTLVPVLCLSCLKGKLRPIEENVLSRTLLKYYERILRFALGRRKKYLLIPALIALAAILVMPTIGREFMPPLDEGTILFMPVMQPAVSLTEAKRIIQVQDAIIKKFPEVEMVVGKLGRAETATDPSPVEMFETIITLKDKKFWRKGMTKDKLMREMNDALQIPGVSNIWTQPIINRIDMLATGIRTSVGVKVFGPDLKKIQEIAQEVENVVRGVKGATDLYSEKIVGKPYVEFKIKRDQIARYGLTIRDVQDVIEMGIGGENITITVEGRERYPVRVRYPRDLRDSPEALARVFVPTPSGAQVPIAQVADIYFVTGPAMINSENSLLRAYVLMNVRGRDMVGFVEEASRAVKERVKLPQGYFLQWSGQFENQMRAKKTLTLLVPLSLVLNFLVIYMNFRSFAKTAFIFTAIPVNMAGGVLLLALSGFNFSVAVWVGFIALFGVAVDDEVLMITYLDETFKDKKIKNRSDIIDHCVRAALGRIRPACLTTLTTIFALLPVMFLKGTGSEMMRPMAVPVLGGMLLGVTGWLTMPILYSFMKEAQIKKEG